MTDTELREAIKAMLNHCRVYYGSNGISDEYEEELAAHILTEITTAQAKLLREVLEGKELLQYLNSEPRTGQVEAVPVSVIYQKIKEME